MYPTLTKLTLADILNRHRIHLPDLARAAQLDRTVLYAIFRRIPITHQQALLVLVSIKKLTRTKYTSYDVDFFPVMDGWEGQQHEYAA